MNLKRKNNSKRLPKLNVLNITETVWVSVAGVVAVPFLFSLPYDVLTFRNLASYIEDGRKITL